jgi:lambda family phage minor tail protein L
MLSISSAAIAEKNKIATASAWLVLLEIQLDAETIRLVNNNQNVSWNSQTWLAFPFEVDTVEETGKGEIPSVSVKVSNVTGEIMQYLEAEDGANGVNVVIRVINSDASANDTAEVELTFIVDRTEYDEALITFHLTGANCLTRRVPPRRYLKNFCGFVYGSIRCGVPSSTVSTYPTCNKSYADCEERGNDSRFGGFRWIPEL